MRNAIINAAELASYDQVKEVNRKLIILELLISGLIFTFGVEGVFGF